MSAVLNDNCALIDINDVTLDYFAPAIIKYPNLYFTNINDKGAVEKHAVFVYHKDSVIRGNRFIEIWQHRDRFDFVMKKSIMTEEEKRYAAEHDRKPTSIRGTVKRCMTYRKELLDYIIPKLDMIEAAK